MRIIIISIYLLIGCSQVTNNSGEKKSSVSDGELLASLTVAMNNNITNQITNTVNVSGGNATVDTDVSSTSDVDGYTYSGPTTVAVNNTANRPINDVQEFLRYDFYFHDRLYTNFADSERECNIRSGFKMVSFREFLIFVKLMDYTSRNIGRVPTSWQITYTGSGIGRGNRIQIWLSDRNGLYSDDLAYFAKLDKFPSNRMWFFNYADVSFDYIWNKSYFEGFQALCYRLK